MLDICIIQVSACPTCQSLRSLRTQAPSLKRIKVTQPMEVVGMDLVGKCPCVLFKDVGMPLLK